MRQERSSGDKEVIMNAITTIASVCVYVVLRARVYSRACLCIVARRVCI